MTGTSITAGMPRVPGTILALVVVAAAMWTALGSLVVESARRHDFLNLYTGGKLALEGRFADMHVPEVQLEYERRLVPDVTPVVPFVRPHFYSLFLAPLALFEYRFAFWLWIGFQTLALLGCQIWGLRRFGPEGLAMAALFLPTALGIAHGQDCVLMLAVSIGAYSLMSAGKPFAGGAVLALGFAKFHLFLLWPVALVVTRRWRMLAGLAAGAAAETAISLALGGWTGVERYVAFLRKKDLERLSPSPELMVNAQGIAANLFGESVWAVAGLSLAALALWAWAIRGAPPWRLWTATTLAGLLIAPHVYGYDAALVLLPIWLTVQSGSKPARIAATLASTPIPYLMNLADSPWCALAALTLFGFSAAVALSVRRNKTGECGDTPREPNVDRRSD